ncbi:10631_t:CDS:10 [Funneliformis mosseae]|uniref:10631_t:CDS:1 n=1 Tax=Funneliformis mosseae TaxID=27381 RepID=A0A9N8ZYW3_FUNMO|nr:10631_t:CDS:10 [Funneliformis mosseae]
MYVHRCRFVEYMPAAINALAFTPSTTKPLIACGRANGDIEIWNPLNLHLEKRILGELNTSVEAITWAHKITLTEADKITYNTQAKRDKTLKELTTEWDTIKLSCKKFIGSHGGAIWCMAVNHANTLIVMMEQAKVMSLTWDIKDKHIVFRASDSKIIKWNVEQGINNKGKGLTINEETIVWAIQVLKDDTIVNGDSLGHVCFWEGTFGNMKQDLGAHDADVLYRKWFVYRIVSQPKSYSKDNSVPNERHWVKWGIAVIMCIDLGQAVIQSKIDATSYIIAKINSQQMVSFIVTRVAELSISIYVELTYEYPKYLDNTYTYSQLFLDPP